MRTKADTGAKATDHDDTQIGSGAIGGMVGTGRAGAGLLFHLSFMSGAYSARAVVTQSHVHDVMRGRVHERCAGEVQSATRVMFC